MRTQSAAFTAVAVFTPAAAAYSANDVMDVAKALNPIGPLRGGEIMILSARLMVAHTAIISGETSYDLHLYNVTPPSAHADNAAWDLPSGDRAAYLGKINLGSPADLGSTLFVEQNGILKPVLVPVGGILYAELVTVGGFTPTAAARTVTLKTIEL